MHSDDAALMHTGFLVGKHFHRSEQLNMAHGTWHMAHGTRPGQGRLNDAHAVLATIPVQHAHSSTRAIGAKRWLTLILARGAENDHFLAEASRYISA
jgi:hypothetical protein